MPIVQHNGRNYFEHNLTTTFGETNVVGNVYFATYIQWQGLCRELFLAECCPEVLDEFDAGYALVTLNLSCEFIDQLYPLQKVLIRMYVEDLSDNRILVAFDYYRREPDGLALVCRSHQSIASMRTIDGRIQPVAWPACIVDSIRDYGLEAT